MFKRYNYISLLTFVFVKKLLTTYLHLLSMKAGITEFAQFLITRQEEH